MRFWIMGAAGLSLLALSATAGVNPATAAVAASTGAQAPIVLAQAEPKKKSETTTQKVKRAWKKMTGYKFAVACPALLPLSHSTCTETGKNRADAKAKCQAASPLCSVTDAK